MQELIDLFAPCFGESGLPSLGSVMADPAKKAQLVKRVRSSPAIATIESRGFRVLWVTPFVHPRLLFCSHHAVRHRYSQYFTAIVLSEADTEAIERLHAVLHDHYALDPSEKTFTTITELLEDGHIQKGTDLYVLPAHCEDLGFQLTNSGTLLAAFEEYSRIVTGGGRWSFCVQQVLVASHELGYVYVGLEPPADLTVECTSLLSEPLRALGLEMLAPIAIIAAANRNAFVLDTLEKLSPLLEGFTAHARENVSMYRNIGLTKYERNRQRIADVLAWLNSPNGNAVDSLRRHRSAVHEHEPEESVQHLAAHCHECKEIILAECARLLAFRTDPQLESGHAVIAEHLFHVFRSRYDEVEFRSTLRESLGSLGDRTPIGWLVALCVIRHALAEKVQRRNLEQIAKCTMRRRGLLEHAIKVGDGGLGEISASCVFEPVQGQSIEIPGASSDRRLSVSDSRVKADSLTLALYLARECFEDFDFEISTCFEGDIKVSGYRPRVGAFSASTPQNVPGTVTVMARFRFTENKRFETCDTNES